MAIQIPLKYTKSGGVATGFQEFESTDQLPANVIAGLVGRNMLINCGVPVINQRAFAGGALAANVYGYDRWKAGTGGCNITINSTTGVFTHNSGPLVQVVETPEGAWGVPLTLSVESPSGTISVNIGGATGSITAGTGRRSVTLTPTGSGNMIVQLTATGVTYSQPRLERGEVATAPEYRPPSIELILCQRYGEGVIGREFVSTAFAVNDITGYVDFKVVKRATPSITVRATGTWVGNGAVGTITTIVVGNISDMGFRIDPTVFTGSVTPGFGYVIRGTSFFADSEL